MFAGGFTLDAAERVCVDDQLATLQVLDLLNSLIDKSLVVVDDDPSGRYRLLETIRQFASGRLAEAGEVPSTRDRHLNYFLAFAQRSEVEIERLGTAAELDLLERERDNCGAALEWALATHRSDDLLAMATSLTSFWVHHGHYLEGQTWLRRALEAPSEAPALKARAVYGLGHLSLFAMDVEHGYGYQILDDALALANEIGDDRTAGRATTDLAYLESWMTGPASAKFEQGIARSAAVDDDYGVAFGSFCEGVIRAIAMEDHKGAAPRLGRAQRVAERMGNAYFPAWVSIGVGIAASHRGDFHVARPELEGAVALSEANGEPALTLFATMALADLDIAEGRYESARHMCSQAAERLRRSARSRAEGIQIMLAAANWASGDAAEACRMLNEVRGTVMEIGLPYLASLFELTHGRSLAASGDVAGATSALDASLTIARNSGNPWLVAETLVSLGALAAGRGGPDDGEDVLQQAVVLQLEHSFHPGLVRSLEALAAIAIANESRAEAVRLVAAAHSARAVMGYCRPPVEQPGLDATAAACLSTLGEEGFGAAWDEGTALSLVDAAAYVRRARGERRRPSAGWKALTPVENEVVRLVAEGLTNPEIAQRLFTARSTVKTHLKHIFVKLGMSTRAELAAQATKHGLVDK